jgi:arylsulfatase A-like enzyme
MKITTFNLLGTSILSCLTFSSSLRANNNNNPNIILVMVDDMGYGDFGCYGNKVNQTPNIDRLAEKGMKFTDFHTNGAVSSPTRAALMTGRYQQYAGIEGVITAASHRDHGLDPSSITIAKLLRANNYETVIYGKWHLGYPVKHNPIYLGFDKFVGYISGNIDYFSHIDQEGYEDWWHQDKLHPEEGYTTHLITDYAERYLEQKHNKPFFLYLPFEACHGPWQGPNDKPVRGIKNGTYEKYEGRKDTKVVYTEMVKSLDDCMGRIVESLRKTGLEENTLILFFSDNGGSSLSCNAPWSGGKGSLLEGGHRVSSIAYWPKMIKAGSVSDETILTMDVLPTLCEATSTTMEGVFDGESFLQTLISGKKMPERTLFWRTHNSVCARHGDWKLTIDIKSGKTKLVNLSTDIKEKKNLCDQYPNKVRGLQNEIKQWEKGFRNIKQLS